MIIRDINEDYDRWNKPGAPERFASELDADKGMSPKAIVKKMAALPYDGWGTHIDFDKPFCHIDKEIAEILLPIYKAKYLDRWQEYVGNISETYPDKLKGFVGIRDGFSVLCNDLGVLPWDCEGDIRKFENN